MAVLELSGVVTALADSTITVERPVAGAYDESGAWVPGDDPDSISTRASVQPTRGKDVQRVPEGRRVEDSVTIYTPGLVLRAPDPVAGTSGDVAIVGSRRYAVQAVEDWLAIGGYGKAVAVAEDA